MCLAMTDDMTDEMTDDKSWMSILTFILEKSLVSRGWWDPVVQN
jgi:hypothetical protein